MFGFNKKKDWTIPKIRIIETSGDSTRLESRRKYAELAALTCPECGYNNKEDNIFPTFCFGEEDTGLSVAITTCKKCGCKWETKCDLYHV